MTFSPPVSPSTARAAEMTWTPIAVIALAQMLSVSNAATLSLSVGGIVAEFDAPISTVQLGLVVFSLVTAAFMILGGRLGALVGSRRLFRVAMLLYAAGMAGVALSVAPIMILAAQVVNGLATAALVPSLIALIASNYQGRPQVLAIGILSAAVGVGISVALLVAGIAGSAAGWRAPFWLLAALALSILIASSRLKPTPRKPGVDIDWAGAVLSAVAIPLLLLGINNIRGWGLLSATPAAPFQPLGLSPALILIVAGIIVTAVFFAWQSSRLAAGRAPLLSPVVLNTLAKRSAVLAQLLTVTIHGSIIFLLPIYTQIALGLEPLGTSLRMLAYTLPAFVASIFTARLIGKLSVRRLAQLAFILIAAGLGLCALALQSSSPEVLFGLGLALTGVGAGTANTVVANVLVSSSPVAVAGEVGAVRGTVNNLGGALGASLSGVVLATALTAALATGLAASPSGGGALGARLGGGEPGFVSDWQLERLAGAAAASPEELAIVMRVNEVARLQALEVIFFVLGGIALLAFLLVARLPAALPKQETAEGVAAAQGAER